MKFWRLLLEDLNPVPGNLGHKYATFIVNFHSYRSLEDLFTLIQSL